MTKSAEFLRAHSRLSAELGRTHGRRGVRSSIGVPRGACDPLDFILRHGVDAIEGGSEYMKAFVAARAGRSDSNM